VLTFARSVARRGASADSKSAADCADPVILNPRRDPC
jgi:hypothetical protein